MGSNTIFFTNFRKVQWAVTYHEQVIWLHTNNFMFKFYNTNNRLAWLVSLVVCENIRPINLVFLSLLWTFISLLGRYQQVLVFSGRLFMNNVKNTPIAVGIYLLSVTFCRNFLICQTSQVRHTALELVIYTWHKLNARRLFKDNPD